MSGFSFTLPNGKTFELKGPPSLTKEQAQAIFDKQAKTGALVGFKPGDTLSAATQAASGLASAQAQVAQALSGVTGALGAGIPGAAGAIGKVSGTVAAAGGALNGVLSGVAAGLTGAIGPAVSSVTGVITGAAGQIGAVATQSISTINKAITSTAVTAPIDIATFAKQTPALTSIGNMSQPDVTAVLAQAKNLVGQGAAVLSNAKGAGEFGLNVSQLETAGILKPGTAALATVSGASLSAILKSPAVYTGKDGIKSVSNLLSNVPKQAEIQQQLMAKGLGDLAAVGIPVNYLSAQGAAGVALSAAKNAADTENLLKNLPVTADAKAAFDANVRDGAFAVNLAQTKVPDVFKAVDTPVPSADTVNRATLDAATTRVLGNDKIPAPNYSTTVADIDATDAQLKQGFDKIADYSDSIKSRQAALEQKVSVLENQESITQVQWEAVNAERISIRDDYTNVGLPTVINTVVELYNSALPIVQRAFRNKLTLTQQFQRQIIEKSVLLNERVKKLKSKIEGAGA